MSVVNKQFELLEFVFDYVYVDLQYDEIFLTFTAGSVSVCLVCSRLWSVCVVCCGTLCGYGGYCDCDVCTIVCVAYVYAESVRVTAMLVWGMDKVWLVQGMWEVHVVQVLCLVQLTCYG